MKPFIDPKDSNSSPAYLPQFGYRCLLQLTANVEKILAVPAGAEKVTFGSSGPFMVSPDATVSLAGDVVDGTGPEVNPFARSCIDVTNIHFISPVSCWVSATFYRDR